MKKHYLPIILALFFLPFVTTQAQVPEHCNCRELMEDLQDCLDNIVNDTHSDKEKDAYIQRALQLFLGEGEVYSSGGSVRNPVQVTVPQTRGGQELFVNISLKRFLKDLKTQHLQHVKIEKVEIVSPSEFFQVDDHYEGVGVFYQCFVSKNGEYTVYRDRTKKPLSIRVELEEKEGVMRGKCKFGDISVVEE